MADIDWKPLPTGLWTPPAVFAEVGNLFLQAFTDDDVPTWEIGKKTEEPGEWIDRDACCGVPRALFKRRTCHRAI